MRRHLLLWFLGALFTLPVGACATSDCAAADANCNDLQALLLYGLQARYVTVGAGGIIAVGSSPTSWTVASPGAGNLNAVAYGSRGFVAVGAAGQIWHSIDGRPGTWFARSSGTTDNLTGVAASGGTYIAAGGIAPNPRILRSTDAIQWTDVTAPIGQPLLQAAYLPVSGGQFVVTGLNGARAVSANGINWTIFSPASDNLLGGIAYGNGRVVCGSDSGVVFSGDGVATMAALGSVSGAVTSGVVFYRGAFLMASDGGEVYRSASGIGAAQQLVSPDGEARNGSVASSEAVVNVGGNSSIIWTEDGFNWHGPVNPPGPLMTLTSVAFTYLPLSSPGL